MQWTGHLHTSQEDGEGGGREEGGGGRGEGGGHTQVNMLERALRSYAPKLVKNTAMNGSSLSVCAIVQKLPLVPHNGDTTEVQLCTIHVLTPRQ